MPTRSRTHPERATRLTARRRRAARETSAGLARRANTTVVGKSDPDVAATTRVSAAGAGDSRVAQRRVRCGVRPQRRQLRRERHGPAWPARARPPEVGAGRQPVHACPRGPAGPRRAAPAQGTRRRPVPAALSAGATSGLLVVLAHDRLGGGEGFGLLIAGIGARVRSGRCCSFAGSRTRDVRCSCSAPTPFRGLVDLALTVVTTVPLAIGALLFYGLSTSTGNVTFASLIRSRVPEHLRGRAFSGLTCYGRPADSSAGARPGAGSLR